MVPVICEAAKTGERPPVDPILDSALLAATRQAVVAAGQRQVLTKDEGLFSRGDRDVKTFMVLSGSVAVENVGFDGQKCGPVIVPGRFIGSFGNSNVPVLFSARALDDLEVVSLADEVLVDLCRAHSDLADEIKRSFDFDSLALWELSDCVERGQISGHDAQTWLSKMGRSAVPARRPRVGVDAAYWPLGLAVAWIMQPDEEAAHATWALYRQWGLVGLSDHPWRAAANDLLGALTNGDLEATGCAPGSSRLGPISPHDWCGLDLRPQGRSVVAVSQEGRVALTNVRVSAVKVKQIWQSAGVGEVKRRRTIAAETECRRRLIEMMRADRDNPKTLHELSDMFPVGQRALRRARKEAAEEAHAPKWVAPGRPKKLASEIQAPTDA